MLGGYRSTEELDQDLADAGFSEEMTARFLSCLLQGDKAESLCRLEEHRAKLLDEIHRERSCIEFLDEQICSLKGQIK